MFSLIVKFSSCSSIEPNFKAYCLSHIEHADCVIKLHVIIACSDVQKKLTLSKNVKTWTALPLEQHSLSVRMLVN